MAFQDEVPQNSLFIPVRLSPSVNFREYWNMVSC